MEKKWSSNRLTASKRSMTHEIKEEGTMLGIEQKTEGQKVPEIVIAEEQQLNIVKN